MAYTYSYKNYRYCDSYTGKTVTVRMGIPSGSDYTYYDDTVCSYKTWTKTLIFDLTGGSITQAITIRFNYDWEQTRDYGDTTYIYDIVETVLLPAGQVHAEREVVIKEERWCSSGGDSGSPIVHTAV